MRKLHRLEAGGEEVKATASECLLVASAAHPGPLATLALPLLLLTGGTEPQEKDQQHKPHAQHRTPAITWNTFR